MGVVGVGVGNLLEQLFLLVVERVTGRSVRRRLQDYRGAGHPARRAGLVVGSVIDPTRIANDHIRAHALEGRLFRTVLERAVRSFRLPCAVIVERRAYATAADRFKRRENDVKRAVTELGRAIEGPWRADEKTAALAAWVAFRGCAGPRRSSKRAPNTGGDATTPP